MSWLENLDKPITEVHRCVESYERQRRFFDEKKDRVVRYHYKVEWLQGAYKTFRRFKEDESEEMERFWQHLLKVSAKNNPKIEDLI